LAGLLIARFLKLPVEATYHDAVGRLAQALTRDGLIEDLSWKYLAWFYNQVDAVYVPSRDVQRDLQQKGVAPDRLRLFTRSAPGVRAAGYRPTTMPQAV
jgi:hypothetical protein